MCVTALLAAGAGLGASNTALLAAGAGLGASNTALLAAGAVAAGAGLGASKLLTAKPKTAPLVDPSAERAAAEAKATQTANSKLAERNRSRRASSLLAVDTATSNVPALGGKATLGQ